MSGIGWGLMTIGGPLLLGILLAVALIKRRRLTPR
jgi:hypothetical protein